MSRGAGRTSWYSEDAGWHRRELVVELGDEYGSGAVNTMRTLRDIAQEQLGRNYEGVVLSGFRTLAKASFVSVAEAREFVEVAAGLGILDDLVVLDDGKRFTCRVSGWGDDQERGHASLRKRDQRAAKPEPDDIPASPPEGTCPAGEGQGPVVSSPNGTTPPLVPSEGDVSRVTIPNLTRPQRTEERDLDRPDSMTYEHRPVAPDTIDAAVGLLDVFNEVTGRNVGAVKGTGTASDALRQIVGAMLGRPHVSAAEWERAIRNTAKAPPDWARGELQIGTVFGPRAADHALTNTGAPAAAPLRPVGATVAAGDEAIAEHLRGVA